MGLYRHSSETLPDRIDFSGVVMKSHVQSGLNEYGSRFRRGRRFGRVAKNGRCSVWTFFIVLLFLIYLAFFGMKFPFHGSPHLEVYQETFGEWPLKAKWKNTQLDKVGYDDGSGEDQISNSFPKSDLQNYDSNVLSSSVSRNGTSLSSYAHQDRLGMEIPFSQRPRTKPRKRHFACEIGFSKSVDYLVEPKDFMKFTQFSLKYVDKEETFYGGDNVDIYKPRFGGHQTLEERENSFYAKDQTLHCGFVKGPIGSPSTGFDLNEKDKEYMNTCRIVVSSCIFGSSDFLRRPTSRKMSTYSKNNVCFVMFVDEQTMATLSLEGQVSDNLGYIGLWKIVIVRNLPYIDMRRTGKVPKFLSHRLFPSARYSIWIDSKMRLHTDPMLILEYFLWRNGSEYAISNHYDRHCVWEEVLQNKRLDKYNHTAIDEQFYFYQSDGLVKFNKSDPDAPLPSYVPEGSFIVRAHSPTSNLFSCLWFNEVDRFTSRDQLSFAYTFLKLKRMNPGKPFFLNMFKDCERRAMTKLFHHRAEQTPP